MTTRPKTLGEMLHALVATRTPALLSLFYFLTFGGFVAFSIYLPTLLKDEFGLTPADAGFRTAGFVVLATVLRPSAACCRTASAAHACSRSCSSASRRSRCSSAGTR